MKIGCSHEMLMYYTIPAQISLTSHYHNLWNPYFWKNIKLTTIYLSYYKIFSVPAGQFQNTFQVWCIGDPERLE